MARTPRPVDRAGTAAAPTPEGSGAAAPSQGETPVEAAPPTPSPALGPSLVPELRDRLQARLHAMGVPPEHAVAFVARLTQRAAQSVRRWFDPVVPGLPDLASFARLCVGIGCRADELLGTQALGTALTPQDTLVVADYIQAVAATLAVRGRIGTPMRVPGDEMATLLREGDLVLVDTSIDRLAGNGIYVLQCGDQVLFRRIEQRPPDRLVLLCDNRAYRDWDLPAADAAPDGPLRILGKVHAAMGLQLF